MHRRANDAENTSGPVRLILPNAIYAAPGIETNIYFDNVVLVVNPANYVFRVTCPKGTLQAERWTFTPTSEEAGEYPLSLEVLDQNNTIVARGNTTVRVVSADAGTNRTISMLCIGDSLTHHSIYTGHLLDLCSSASHPRLTLIGTHNPPESASPINRHEGYGGWSAEMFITRYTGVARTGDYQQRGSPFLYEGPDGKPQLDFARYCHETNASQAPNVVTIFLGTNDVFHATEENLSQYVDRMLRYHGQLVDMIRGFDPRTIIGVIPPTPPAASQDAFGSNYGCQFTRWQYKRNQHRAVECLIERYRGREEENLYLIPAFTNLDSVHNYPQITKPWNSRTAQTATRLDNGVHPSDEGYRQIGDSIYAWLKAVMRA